MAPISDSAGPTGVKLSFELFGRARMIAGKRIVQCYVPASADASALAATLAIECPELVGDVLRSDGLGLQRSYTFNLNGTSFLDDHVVNVGPDDRILLFSSQAGG